MKKDAFFKYVESRAQNAYGSAFLVKDPDTTKNPNGKFSLLIASETVPAIFGSQGSFEFNLINAKVIGKVSDKSTLEDKETEFLLHRDNINRLEYFKGKVLEFLYFTPDFMGWRFTGQISARPNDATADILRGTYTITPMSADPAPIMDARSLIIETVTITNAIPDSIQVGTSGTSIDVVCDVEGFTTTVEIKDGVTGAANTKFVATGAGEATKDTATISISGISATAEDYALAYITVSKTGYAPWTTTVALQGGATA